jgi:hypothetical protein
MVDLVKAYRAAWDAGEFRSPPQFAARNAPCKTDAIKLCAWYAARKKNLQGLDFKFLHSLKHGKALEAGLVKDVVSVKPEVEGRRMYDKLRILLRDTFGVDSMKERIVSVGGARARLQEILDLNRRHYAVDRVLGEGTYGAALLGYDAQGNRVVIKVMRPSRNDRNVRQWRWAFLDEVEEQRHFHKVLRGNMSGVFAPEVYESYVLHQDKPQMVAVVIMEPIHGILGGYLDKYHDKPRLIEAIARQLKMLVRVLESKHLVHGDLHAENIGYKKVSDNKVHLYMIDFGRSTHKRSRERLMMRVPHDRIDEEVKKDKARMEKLKGLDIFWVWRASLYERPGLIALNQALRSPLVKFPASDIFPLGHRTPVNKGDQKRLPFDLDKLTDVALDRQFEGYDRHARQKSARVT